MRTKITIALLVLATGLSASAETVINEWNVNDGDKWEEFGNASIRILESDEDTFCFEAYDSVTGYAADINVIETDSGGVTGTVLLTVAPDPESERVYGAANVGEIDLSTADTGTIVDLDISADLATIDDVICDNITGTVTCQDVIHNVTIDYGSLTGSFTANDITGTITIVRGRLNGSLTANTLGDVDLQGVAGVSPHTGSISVTQNYAGTISVIRTFNGTMSFSADVSGTIELVNLGTVAAITVTGTLTGDITASGYIGGDISLGALTGQIDIDDYLTGQIDVAADLEKPGRIVIGDYVAQSDPTAVAIHIQGSVIGEADEDPEDPMIQVASEVGGVIAIDGSLQDAVNGPEIHVGSIDLEGLGAIAIDYDGWDELDEWVPGAQVKVGTQEPYGGNTPAARVYEITGCRGDMNNDGEVNSEDDQAFDDALNDVSQYLSDYPGLGGSREWHGDANADGTFDEDDQASYDFLSAEECCVTDWSFCPTDLDYDGETDLNDLALLLADYGCTSECTADVDGDDDVDLSDLAVLLSVYGDDCDCSGGGPGGGGGRSSIAVYVEAYDTGGYSGGGFKGEVDHFVFDLKIELSDPNDDWVATGAELDAYNDATFRLSTTPTTPDQYATFVAAPWTSVPESATASLAGAYDPPDPTSEFTTTGINLAWYDIADSNDGPATIMRIVIDVSDVEGADVSKGFGSVYFSTTGPAQQEDILVADLASETGTADSVPGLKWLSGEFYVKGEE